MSLDLRNQKCAICSAYLFDEDDVVYCPVCGAPHHRDCYNHLGRCGMEEYHGTDMQYRREEPAEEPKRETQPQPEAAPNLTEVCIRCGSKMEKGSRYCNNCGAPAGMNVPPFAFSPFEQSEVIKETAVIDDGVTAKEAAQVVKSNTFRYIPKFLKVTAQNKKSWNWAAFLLPHGWFAYRKMYKESIITSLLSIITVVLNFPLSLALLSLPTADQSIRNSIQLAEHYAQYANEIGFLPLFLSFTGMVIGLVVRIVCGMYGDYIYKQRVVLSASLIKQAEDTEAAEKKYSGVSFVGFMLAVFAVEFIPTLLSTFLI